MLVEQEYLHCDKKLAHNCGFPSKGQSVHGEDAGTASPTCMTNVLHCWLQLYVWAWLFQHPPTVPRNNQLRQSTHLGGCLGRIWIGNRISSANFYIVLYSSYGSILLSFRDITTRQMDDAPMSASNRYLALNVVQQQLKTANPDSSSTVANFKI